MAFGKLFGYEQNPRTRVVLIAAEFAGIDLELVYTNFFEGLSPEYLAKHHQGKIPSFENDRIELEETFAIASYIIRSSDKPGVEQQLLGSTNEERAKVEMWSSFANTNIGSVIVYWFLPLAAPSFVKGGFTRIAVEKAKVRTLRSLEHLEIKLSDGRKYLVRDDSICLGDIFLACVLIAGFELVLDAEWRAAHPHTMRWFDNVVKCPEVARYVGDSIKMCEKALPFPADMP